MPADLMSRAEIGPATYLRLGPLCIIEKLWTLSGRRTMAV
jgi:hypothetical protein